MLTSGSIKRLNFEVELFTVDFPVLALLFEA